ncbi:MAG: hypothetical protein P3T54_07460 [Dehalogenimonas sp.]|uniref:Alpha/beta hydrolase n=1 Tax=Candidatus Dehalogenimonas loeffleri TaxID=3127115 RepID=A0ABZ2J3W7_9CHLR|nr:hypothetical protein [Dehalogenimonas sp.]
MIYLVLFAVAAVVLTALSWQVPEPGTMRQARNGAFLPAGSPLELPKGVRDDALATAIAAHRHDRKKQLRLATDMLATYRELLTTDVFVLFNSGGYGWSNLDKASGYATIIDAIEEKLVSDGCRVTVLSYQRAYRGVRGYVSEILNAGAKSIAKPKELALRLSFLRRHLPNLQILLTSESNGTVMSNQVMRLLPEDPRLYSLEFGPPFWYETFLNDRILSMRSNGKTPDAFSYGHWRRAITANIMALFGRSAQSPGSVLLYIGAPGHDYNWHDYPVIQESVSSFLDRHFKPFR